MPSKPTTVADYLASLPADRRAALEAVRKVILANLDRDFAEGMQYGMIGYFVPHSRYPAGYHCDPKEPLPFAGLASQKGHMSVHLMGLYVGPDGGPGGETALVRWFREAWTKTGRKLDMGKCCVRFKKLEDVPLDVLGEAFRRLPAKTYIQRYEAVRAGAGKAARARTQAVSRKAKVAPAQRASAPRKRAAAKR